ncbi:hypothetical protein GCM10023224_14010 [Streptomonospora halophila]|uniref:WD40 repeat n=1 Tax=Streptomonospora halophila TaxID=427369 RepID=A0ABP9G9W6_9ACTN
MLDQAPSAFPWAAAVHAHEDDHEPLGAALVIDARRILTSAHVLGGRTTVWIAFPDVPGASRRQASASDVCPSPVEDVALLHLADELPTGAEPAPLGYPRNKDLVGNAWWAFGFANRTPWGNSTGGTIGAAQGYGWVRLDTQTRYQVEPGFSGAGLWSPERQAVVGLVNSANRRGDGQAITLHQIDAILEEAELRELDNQPLNAATHGGWGWSLDGDPEASRHWNPRARGVTVDSERGWRFRGRTAALTAITDWLTRDPPARRALVVTGSPGAGKSAVLSRIVITADAAARATLPTDDDAVRAELGSVACSVHAKGKTALEVAAEIAQAAHVAAPQCTDDFPRPMRQALARRDACFNVVIDALDEASSPEEARLIITAIVRPLVETCADVGARVVMGTRRRDDSGDLLSAFAESYRNIDLDSAEFSAVEDLADYALATLCLVGAERPDSPYAHPATARPIAARIAALSEGNFLIAGLVAHTHGLHDTDPIDPRKLSFTTDVGTTLTRYLARLPPVERASAETVFSALAFADPPGWTAGLWSRAITALGEGSVDARTLTRFTRSAAANFLVATNRLSGERTFRLFHQALNDALLGKRDELAPRSDEEAAITTAFIRAGQQQGWDQAPEYLRTALPGHAARAGMVGELFADDSYPLHAELSRLLAVADTASTGLARRRTRLLRLTPQAAEAPPGARAAMLSVNAALERDTDGFSDHPMAPYRAAWAAAPPRGEDTILEHSGGTTAMCTFTGTDGEIRLVTAGTKSETVMVWNPATGAAEQQIAGHTGGVLSVSACTGPDDYPRIVTADLSRVRIWNPVDGTFTRSLDGYSGWVLSTCTFTGPDGRPRLATGSFDGTVAIWDATSGLPERLLRGHTKAVRTIFGIARSAGRTDLVTGGDDGSVLLWDTTAGTVRCTLQRGGGKPSVRPVACPLPGMGGTARVALIADDGNITVADLETGECVPAAGGRPVGQVLTLLGQVLPGDRSHLVLGSAEGDVWIRDLATGAERTLGSHSRKVTALCSYSDRDGRHWISSSGRDETIRIWDSGGADAPADSSAPAQAPTLCTITATGRPPRIASGDGDRTVLTRSAGTGEVERTLTLGTGRVSVVGALTPADGRPRDTRRVSALCAFTPADGRPRIVIGATDGTLRVQDLEHDRPEWSVVAHGAGGVAAVCYFVDNDGRPRLATTGHYEKMRIWDIAERTCERTITGDDTYRIRSVCAFTDPSGEVRLATAHPRAAVRVWASRQSAYLFHGGARSLRSMCAFSTPEGEARLVTAGDDCTVRIWDPATARQLSAIPVHHQVLSLAWADGRLVVGLASGLLAIDVGPLAY